MSNSLDLLLTARQRPRLPTFEADPVGLPPPVGSARVEPDDAGRARTSLVHNVTTLPARPPRATRLVLTEETQYGHHPNVELTLELP